MVIDKLTRIDKYTSALPNLAEALACLEQVKGAVPGRYEFNGGFILMQEGSTTPIESGDFEAHRKYLDVQILLDGAETILWADLDDLIVSVPYNDLADRSSHSGTGCSVEIMPGMFYICYPHDAHKCCCHIDTPSKFHKAVIKLSLVEQSPNL